MITSDLIKAIHLSLLAIIYIRQSSPHQALTNQESLRLQYALKQLALDLGWREDQILIIDSDQGHTASTTGGRQGFKELVTLVTLEQVGIILSIEVTRLPATAQPGIPCSISAVTAAASSAIAMASTTRPRSTGACSWA